MAFLGIDRNIAVLVFRMIKVGQAIVLFTLKPISKTSDQWYQELTYYGVGIENFPGRRMVGILALVLTFKL
jgi:hypothetical protein